MFSSRCWQLLTVIGFMLTTATATVDDNKIISTDAQQLLMEGPIIDPPLNEVILQKGQNFTIYCKGNEKLQFKQQEIPEEVVGNFSTKHRDVLSSEIEYKYKIAIDLYNVDQFAVGYYACFDSTVNSSDVLNNIVEEPVKTGHISYIYIYVNGSESILAPMREVIITRGGTKFVIECRPTSPDIKVNLTLEYPVSEYEKYSPKVGFTVDSDLLLDDSSVIVSCDFTKEHSLRQFKEIVIHKYRSIPPPKPQVVGRLKNFLNGETFSLNCSVIYQKNYAVMLSWNLPTLLNKNLVIKETNEHAVTDGKLYYNIVILNATKEAEGAYTCISKNSYGQSYTTFNKIFLEKPFLKLTRENKPYIETSQKFISLLISIEAYPEATFTFYRNNEELTKDRWYPKAKYIIQKKLDGSAMLSIYNLNVNDTANYTMVATNKYLTENTTYEVRVKSPPVIDFGPSDDRKNVENTIVTLVCAAVGYPIPIIDWIFSNDEEEITLNSESVEESIYKVKSFLKMPVRVSGNITCHASNIMNSSRETRNFLVWEIPGGFGIKNEDETWFYENQNVVMECLASKYDFVNVTWLEQIDEDKEAELTSLVEYKENSFSLVAKLKIDHISMSQAGNYTCVGTTIDDSEEDSRTISITVAATRPLRITDPKVDKIEEVYPYQSVYLTCQADAVPPPIIEWYKDSKHLLNDSNISITKEYLDHTILNSTVEIKKMQINSTGKYECIAKSQDMVDRKAYNVNLNQTEKSAFKALYAYITGVLFFFLILMLLYMSWRIRKEKRSRKELEAAGLGNFGNKKELIGTLNPELAIDEQADLLPYDKKFEFPPEKLSLGKQLGAGAFGVVYKAEARGIINAEETTTVAVKMVKKTAENMYIKALASELKIMVHLGKHINIVNLLGACTKKVGKRELIVIVEYCKYGNIHNYMQKHREVFIDQLTDNMEKTLGNVNRGFSCSSGNSGMQSDYYHSQSQNTEHTFLNSAGTSRSGRKQNANHQVEFAKVSETGYVQPEWRSNYESDYSFDGRSPRPLCSRDLLCWAFQIARGMEYLVSRKLKLIGPGGGLDPYATNNFISVLHGDLAARNILLADDNIVKICDFGLARSIYKNDEYQKKENSPLPVKWLAIECMTDRIFSTQSDVWSFGIVLWELFSLAKTPYPNISPSNLLKWLSEGNRLEKPHYADERLHEVMLRCWEQKPTARPTFSQLQEALGSYLEDNVRNHYVDLNSMYMDMNQKREGQEDYLDMVCAPDYNNLVTPSPHHYVNDARSFFPPTPTQLQHDDEGYLQMSPVNQAIFSPRAQGTKFDFDARKLNPKVSEVNSHGSELTPMLTLNNLPARSGSESDHEGNASPYLNMCPRIEEEADEVFEMKQTNENNVRNIQNCAVTNPTYITFDVDIEKKPKDITNTNNYINVSTPNSLVK